MRPHMAVVRALAASSASHRQHRGHKDVAHPTLLPGSGKPALATPVVAAGIASAPAGAPREQRGTAYPLNGFDYLTVSPANAPQQSETDQVGTNSCGQYGASRQDSMCQNIFVNGPDDFCLFAPPWSDGRNASIGETEREEVSWCTKAGYGTRLIPDGTLTSVSFVQTPEYVQIVGTGNFQNLGIPITDQGGELDPHGADNKGNPRGGMVWSSSFVGSYGVPTQSHEWTMFISSTLFCFRACSDGPNASSACNHVYDLEGCDWNMPTPPLALGTFESCKGDAVNPPMGIYIENGVTSTFTNGAAVTPSAHPAPAQSLCTTQSSIPVNGATVNAAFAKNAPAPSAGPVAVSSMPAVAPAPAVTLAPTLAPTLVTAQPAAQSGVVGAVSAFRSASAQSAVKAGSGTRVKTGSILAFLATGLVCALA